MSIENKTEFFNSLTGYYILQKEEDFFYCVNLNLEEYLIYIKKNSSKNTFCLSIIQIKDNTNSYCYRKTYSIDDYKKFIGINSDKFNTLEELVNPLLTLIKKGRFKISQKNIDIINFYLILGENNIKQAELNKVHKYYNSFEKDFSTFFERIDIKCKIIKILNDKNKTEKVSLVSTSNESQQKISRLQKDLSLLSQNLTALTSKLTRPPPKTGPTREEMMQLPKQERYRILGISSDIIQTLDEVKAISNFLSQEMATKLEMYYKGTVDGAQSLSFHAKCDNLVPSLILFETVDGIRFGGFTRSIWKICGHPRRDESAFLFSINLLEKYPIVKGQENNAIYSRQDTFFKFGDGDLTITDNCEKNYSFSNFPVSYNNPNIPQDQMKLRLTCGRPQFALREIEVFYVNFALNRKAYNNVF